MKSVATIKLKIPKKDELIETMRQYSKSVQIVSDWGWELKSYDKRELHDITYYQIRESTNLPAQLVCSSRNVACDVLKASIRNNGGKPAFKELATIRYDARSFSFKNRVVSLSTVKGRVKFNVDIPEYFRQYLNWKACSADMIFKDNKLFLNIVVSRDVNIDSFSCRNGKTVGIDVGISNIAVTSDKRFFNATTIKTRRIKYRRLRTKLQAKGTRTSKRLLKKISGRERRFMAWANHNVSKAIINSISKGDTIVMEKLTGIMNQSKGKKFNFWLNGWSFCQFQSFVEYKALRKRVRTIKVSPKNTSKTCSKCGSLNTSCSKSFFRCLHCGYTLNVDLNASLNLANHHSIADGDSVAVNQPNLAHDDAEASVTMN